MYPTTEKFREFLDRHHVSGGIYDYMLEAVGEYEHGSADLDMPLEQYVSVLEDIILGYTTVLEDQSLQLPKKNT
jgi:hypothetical protein